MQSGSSGTGERRNTLVAGFTLLAILVVFFNDALLPGRVLSPADAAFSTPLYEGEAPEGYEQPSNSLLFDQVYQFTPWRHFAWTSLRDGELPLWNPHSLSGTPMVATMQSAVFYPLNLLLVAVPFESTFILSALIRLWIAGFFTYLLARRYGLGLAASVISGIAFMLSGFLVSWLGHPHVNVAVWLPALLLAADQLALARGRKQAIRGIALLALVVGVQFTGGHIETSADMLFGAGLYFLLRWGTNNIDLLRGGIRRMAPALGRLLVLPLAYLLGAGIAAVQLLPFLEWLPLSAEFHTRSQSGFRLVNPDFIKNLLSLPAAVFPNVYNNPTWNFPYWSFNPWGNFNETALYVGAIPLVLAAITLLTHWRECSLVRIWGIVAGVSLAMALQLPVFDWLNQIPGRDLAHPNRLRLIATFGLAILAGFGAQALWSDEVARRWFGRLAGAVAVAGTLLMIGGGLLLPQIEDTLVETVPDRLDSAAAEGGEEPATFTYCRTRVEECVDEVIDAFSPGNVEMYTPALFALTALLVLVVWSRHRRRPRALQAAILVVVVIELVSFGEGYNPTVARENFYPEPALLERVDQHEGPGRFTVLQQSAYPDVQMMYGLSDIRGLDFPTKWYDDYLNVAEGRIPWLDYGVLLSSVDSPLLTNLNVRYVVTPDLSDIGEDGALRLIDQQEGIYLAEFDNVHPRARIIYDVVTVADDDAALAILREDPAMIHQRIVLFDDEVDTAAGTGSTPAAGNSRVALESYAAQQSRWNVTSGEPGFLLLKDAYYPGWEAYVDGNPVQILRANVAFRAVPVPAGQHVVEFRYQPGSVRLGFVVSLASLTVILILLGWSWKLKGLDRR